MLSSVTLISLPPTTTDLFSISHPPIPSLFPRNNTICGFNYLFHTDVVWWKNKKNKNKNGTAKDRVPTTSGKEATVVVIQHVQQQDPSSSTYSPSFSLPLWTYLRALVGKGWWWSGGKGYTRNHLIQLIPVPLYISWIQSISWIPTAVAFGSASLLLLLLLLCFNYSCYCFCCCCCFVKTTQYCPYSRLPFLALPLCIPFILRSSCVGNILYSLLLWSCV